MKALLAAILFPLVALAADVTLPASLSIGDEKYTGVAYLSNDGAFLQFTHDAGIARVRISQLPADLQNALGYNAKDEAAALENEKTRRQNVAAADQMRAQKQQLAQAISAMEEAGIDASMRAISVTKEGAICMVDDLVIFVYGLQCYDGDRVESRIYPAGSYNYTAVSGAAKRVRAFATTPRMALALLAGDGQ